jgi:hypothetical protein
VPARCRRARVAYIRDLLLVGHILEHLGELGDLDRWRATAAGADGPAMDASTIPSVSDVRKSARSRLATVAVKCDVEVMSRVVV